MHRKNHSLSPTICICCTYWFLGVCVLWMELSRLGGWWRMMEDRMGCSSSQFSLIQHFAPLTSCKRLPFTQGPSTAHSSGDFILPMSKRQSQQAHTCREAQSTSEHILWVVEHLNFQVSTSVLFRCWTMWCHGLYSSLSQMKIKVL